jgi:hypothetical protein
VFGKETLYRCVAGKFTPVGGGDAFREGFHITVVGGQVAVERLIDDFGITALRGCGQLVKAYKDFGGDGNLVHGELSSLQGATLPQPPAIFQLLRPAEGGEGSEQFGEPGFPFAFASEAGGEFGFELGCDVEDVG